MKCILRIGYTDIVLPDINGIEKLVDALSKGMECEKVWHTDYRKPPEITLKSPVRVEFELLPPDTKFKASVDLAEKIDKETGPKRLAHIKLLKS